jgi:hypothetical protein
LTRDRRGTENTFLMHADRPGDRPRLLYWYRTAPGITLGRSPLDEDAIRTIEEQHPDIDFDWPAILALSEVMTPEDEAPSKPARDQRGPRESRRPKRETEPGPATARHKSGESRRPSESSSARDTAAELPHDDRDEEPAITIERSADPEIAPQPAREAPVAPRQSSLVDQLAGREIASRLRGRYAEIAMRIRGADAATRDGLMTRADALDPDRWVTPEAVLQGVSNADALYEALRAQLHSSRE